MIVLKIIGVDVEKKMSYQYIIYYGYILNF